MYSAWAPAAFVLCSPMKVSDLPHMGPCCLCYVLSNKISDLPCMCLCCLWAVLSNKGFRFAPYGPLLPLCCARWSRFPIYPVWAPAVSMLAPLMKVSDLPRMGPCCPVLCSLIKVFYLPRMGFCCLCVVLSDENFRFAPRRPLLPVGCALY